MSPTLSIAVSTLSAFLERRSLALSRKPIRVTPHQSVSAAILVERRSSPQPAPVADDPALHPPRRLDRGRREQPNRQRGGGQGDVGRIEHELLPGQRDGKNHGIR